MSLKYNYLISTLKYQNSARTNIFYKISEQDIARAEEALQIAFPSELREFYQNVGYGFLVSPYNVHDEYDFCNTNRINHPNTIAEILLDGPDSGIISETAYELLEPGDLPFFEIGDSTRFLIMKPNSANPNAVWSFGNIKIEDSFEKFIWRLYYESPSFYDDIIEAAYSDA